MTLPATSPTPTPARPPARPETAIWRAVAFLTGCLLTALGSLTALVWGLGDPDYIQLTATLPTLHYNGAVGFLLCGFGYLALATGRVRAARGLAGALALVGGAVLVASVSGSTIRLDKWAFETVNAFPPGGVSPALGLWFCLAGVGLALYTAGGARMGAAVLPIGALLTITGPGALIVGQPDTDLAFRDGPSVLGAVGVGIIGLGLLARAIRYRIPTFPLSHTVPAIVGLLGIGVTLVLWAALDDDQSRRIRRQVQFEAAQVQRLAQDRLTEESNRFANLSAKWPLEPTEQATLDVGSYVGQTLGCLGVCRLDANGTVSWIVAQPGQPTTLADFGVAETLSQAARAGRAAVVRPPRSKWRGARVMLLFAPHRPAPNAGGLVAVLRLQSLFDTFVNSNVAAGYAVTISEGPEPLFVRNESESDGRDVWGETLPLPFREMNWRLTVWPTQAVLSRESLSLPRLSLLIGLFTTALLALAVHLAQTARRRTTALENEVREREQAESAMRQSEVKYRTLIENLGQGIFLQDRDHRFVAANAQFCRGVGRAEAAIIGATEADLYDPHQADGLAKEVRNVLAEGTSIESEQEVAVAGRPACVRRVLTPVRDASGQITGVLGICWDVTEQRRLEGHVNRASKMDAIGQLAGGIAHDFNNLLTVILGNLEVLLAQSPDRSDRELVAAAQGAAVRAAALTQRLLGFARRHQLDWRPTDLNAVTTEVVALLQRTIDPLVRIETHLTPDLWSVQADPTQLNQVLMNLCLNARDAIAGAGEITIETKCISADEARGGNGPAERIGEFVRLRVTDTGAGMPPEVKARIYEPFFTTKEVGRGTGLGLAMVFAIVRQHKGWIDCQSQVGAGTRFDVYLPRGTETKAPAPMPARTPTPSGRIRQGTVLIVDDEEMIRKLAAMTLQASGFRVLQAADGQQAVDVYARERDHIDLILLDLTMPVLSGHEAFRQLLNMNPQVRVVFASGYAVEQLSELEKQMMAGFVKKPYRPNELLLAVEDAIGPANGDSANPTPLPASTPQSQARVLRPLAPDSRPSRASRERVS